MRLWVWIVSLLVLGIGAGVAVALFRLERLTSEVALIPPPKAGPGDARIPAPPPADGPQPVCWVDKETFQFGSMERDEEMSHAFHFRNDGQFPLKLVKGDTTCKCTMSELAEGELPPGGTCEVRLTWVGKGDNPNFRQQATIFTNDRKRPAVLLNVEGKIQASIGFQPPAVNFSNLSPTETRTLEAVIWTTRAGDFQITSHSFAVAESAGLFDVTLEPAPEKILASFSGQKGWLAKITVKPGLPAGEFQQLLVLEHNLPKVPATRIPIVGQVAGDLSLLGTGFTPLGTVRGIVSLGMVTRGEGKKHTIKAWLRGPHRDNVQFKVVSTRPTALQATIGERHSVEHTSVTEVPLIIEVPPDCPSMHFLGGQHDGGALIEEKFGEVVVETDHPDFPKIVLLVKFAVGG